MEPISEKDLLADLNPMQCEAVKHLEGPLLILAGAGSGKTRVITRRVAYLLHQGIPPHNILAITFTNKAAGEMRHRIEALVPDTSVWISTFHSMGARLLRMYADRLGLSRNFTIFDQTDRARLLKLALEDAGMDETRYKPETLNQAISKAKNQLLSPEKYAAKATDFFTQTVAKIYPIYEKRMRDANALDFDDLLYWPALALKNDPELRAELDARFRYVLIDEYQDTNLAQYSIIRSLSQDHPNLCVVGDPDQCLPPGTLVETPLGRRPIETLREGDEVLAGIGWGDVRPMPIDKVMVTPFKGRMVKIRVEGGLEVRATPNHVCFASLRPSTATHFTYLMWKRGLGYRIGTTRGVRVSKDGVILSGLQVRANQEVADAVWILRTCPTAAEARYYENYYSLRYGIPTVVFFVRGRRMEWTQELIDRLYQEIDTQAGALRLMADLHLDPRYPHHRPGGVTRGAWARRHVLFTLFGDHRLSRLQAWHYHRVQMVTTGEELRSQASLRFKTRDGTKGTWRVETSRKRYVEGLALAEAVGQLGETDLISRARLTQHKVFPFMPASHIHPGMAVPVLVGEEIQERRVEAVEWEDYEGLVYDLSVPEVHNFIANGLVVHNSIYKFRGSDIRNILDFEQDFPKARVLTLSTNYRSTRSILHAASQLIVHNRKRKPKTLETENPEGDPVKTMLFDTGETEAEGIARHIKKAVTEGKRRYRDFAVFVRINALTRGLERAFTVLQVPFQIVKGLAFFDRKENRDVLAYLQLLLNPRNELALERIINEPPRGIGPMTLQNLRMYAEPRELTLLEAASQADKIPLLKPKMIKSLKDFAQMNLELSQKVEAAPDEMIREVLDRTGYRQMLKDSKDEGDVDRLANIEEMITSAKQFARENPEAGLAEFVENITLASDVDSWNQEQDTVSVMTMHSAKGLEFPVVFLAAMEHGLIPHERSLNRDDEVEEERRLAFVGMTRAREELYLTHARTREFRGQTLNAIPSMFLEELPRDTLEKIDHSTGATAADHYRGGSAAAEHGWHEAGVRPRPAPIKPADLGLSGAGKCPYAVGMHVRHAEYGEGQVIEVSGHGLLTRVRIRFRTRGERAFIADKVKLEIVGG